MASVGIMRIQGLSVLAEVEPDLFIGLAYPHCNYKVGDVIEEKASPYREYGDHPERVEVMDEGLSLAVDKPDLIGEHGSENHPNYASNPVARKNVESVV
jgi:hypothetical protein